MVDLRDRITVAEAHPNLSPRSLALLLACEGMSESFSVPYATIIHYFLEIVWLSHKKSCISCGVGVPACPPSETQLSGAFQVGFRTSTQPTTTTTTTLKGGQDAHPTRVFAEVY